MCASSLSASSAKASLAYCSASRQASSETTSPAQSIEARFELEIVSRADRARSSDWLRFQRSHLTIAPVIVRPCFHIRTIPRVSHRLREDITINAGTDACLLQAHTPSVRMHSRAEIRTNSTAETRVAGETEKRGSLDLPGEGEVKSIKATRVIAMVFLVALAMSLSLAAQAPQGSPKTRYIVQDLGTRVGRLLLPRASPTAARWRAVRGCPTITTSMCFLGARA